MTKSRLLTAIFASVGLAVAGFGCSHNGPDANTPPSMQQSSDPNAPKPSGIETSGTATPNDNAGGNPNAPSPGMTSPPPPPPPPSGGGMGR